MTETRAPRVPQLVLVWLVGTIVPYGALILIVAAAFAQPPGAVIALLLAVPVAVLAVLLRVIAGRTRTAMPLGDSGGGLWLWTLLVLAGGATLLYAGASVARVLDPSASLAPLVGVPFALVAGLLLRGRQPRLIAAGTLLALFVAGSAMLRASGPDETEERLQGSHLSRDTYYLADIPGYHRVSDGSYLPPDDAIPPYRFINIEAYAADDRDPTPCRPTKTVTLADVRCSAEADGLTKFEINSGFGYEVSVENLHVVLTATAGVDREVLRAGALSLRRTGGTDSLGNPVFAADLPGYQGKPVQGGRGMQYLPVGANGGADSYRITLQAGQFESTPADLCRPSRCAPEPDGGAYRPARHTSGGDVSQAYLLPMAHGQVLVTGGDAVDRELLRRTAQAAHPATEVEILDTLPPVRYRSIVERYRSWLRVHF